MERMLRKYSKSLLPFSIDKEIYACGFHYSKISSSLFVLLEFKYSSIFFMPIVIVRIILIQWIYINNILFELELKVTLFKLEDLLSLDDDSK